MGGRSQGLWHDEPDPFSSPPYSPISREAPPSRTITTADLAAAAHSRGGNVLNGPEGEQPGPVIKLRPPRAGTGFPSYVRSGGVGTPALGSKGDRDWLNGDLWAK